MTKEIECLVSGLVQRVMYRDFVKRSADSRGVVGTVENLADGKVRVIAQGEEKILKVFVSVLHHGSLIARVESVAVDWRKPLNQFDSFQIIG